MSNVNKKGYKRVVIVNAHWNNRGDEAALRAIIDGLLRYDDKICITVVFKTKGDVQQFPYKDRVRYVTDYTAAVDLPSPFKMALSYIGICGNDVMRRVKTIIADCDIVVYAPGGAVISDRFWWKKQLEYLFPIAYAQKKKIPTVFAAPSMGPFTKKHIFRTVVLRKSHAICVREKISKEALETIGVRDNVEVTIDSAFLNEVNCAQITDTYGCEQRLAEFMECYKRIVGITVTDLKWHVEWGKREGIKEYIECTFEAFIRYLDTRNIGVLLIPQLFGEQNDERLLERVGGGIADNAFILGTHLDAYFQQYIISKLYAVVGMRYHSNIFAAKMCVPFIPIIYEEKMEGFAKMINWEELCINFDELTLETLMSKFLILENKHEELCVALKDKKLMCRVKAKLTLDSITDVLDAVKGSREEVWTNGVK